MTDAELWELILISQSNMSSVMAIYISILSGYLIVAYLVGQKLTTFQCLTATGLFVVCSLAMIIACYAFLSRAAFLLQFTDKTYRSPASAFIPYTPYILSAFLFIGVLACLKFMWDVRHPKT